MSKTIDRGTASRTADQIAEELDSRGVSLSVAVNRHAMWLVCTCLTEDFEQILALVGDIAMQPAFPAAEIETRRGEIVTLLRQDQDNPGDRGDGSADAVALRRDARLRASACEARSRPSSASHALICRGSIAAVSPRR